MFLKRAIARLRAAHGLAFAVAAGQTPDPTDIDAAGLGNIRSELFGGRVEGEKPLPTAETPKAVAIDPPADVPASWSDRPAAKAA